MNYKIYQNNIENLETECLIIFVKKSNNFDLSLLPKNLNEFIKKIAQNANFSGKYKEMLFSYNPYNTFVKSVLLVGVGEVEYFNGKKLNYINKKICDELKKNNFSKVTFNIIDIFSASEKNNSMYENIVQTIEYEFYSFNYYKSKKSKLSEKEFQFAIGRIQDEKTILKQIEVGKKIGNGINFARDLGNQPPNICTPEYLSSIAKSLSGKYDNINLNILEKKDMEKLNMGAFLAVSKGSPQPPKMIIMEYKNELSKSEKPIIFVGKGITFDTGGNSLKPSNSMVGMKYDMCGGAAVFGITKIIAELKLPIHFIGVVPAAENIPGGHAAKPDDIVNTHAGISVEILNTDAEGRLILCDALSYIKKYDPSVVIDIATLTGACVVALGREYSGLFTNDNNLAKELMNAGQETNDKCWQMPISKEYSRQLKSNFADVANIGGEAGSITAACFLYQFIKEFKWAHLDVAGTACNFTGSNKQSTGRPIPSLIKYLKKHCK